MAVTDHAGPFKLTAGIGTTGITFASGWRIGCRRADLSYKGETSLLDKVVPYYSNVVVAVVVVGIIIPNYEFITLAVCIGISKVSRLTGAVHDMVVNRAYSIDATPSRTRILASGARADLVGRTVRIDHALRLRVLCGLRGRVGIDLWSTAGQGISD